MKLKEGFSSPLVRVRNQLDVCYRNREKQDKLERDKYQQQLDKDLREIEQKIAFDVLRSW